ncbi:hypothetical protein [Shewanella sp. Isolate11]|uniref:hypothetical protein n=1 Tax=Shewanella sp. Isolate11 TaxID=2908530 RepID=UPI001EFE2504|nr:hypothetical protein [Shewanella sp. Isolate11]MCG9697457.1 hypothetical protein [Shewanella sp. Isolate11]
MSELTEKQRKYREWYQRNKAKVCADKRAKYQSPKPKPAPKKSKAQTKVKSLSTDTSPFLRPINSPSGNDAKVERFKVSEEDVRRLKARRSVEDILLARELGIGVEELA